MYVFVTVKGTWFCGFADQYFKEKTYTFQVLPSTPIHFSTIFPYLVWGFYREICNFAIDLSICFLISCKCQISRERHRSLSLSQVSKVVNVTKQKKNRDNALNVIAFTGWWSHKCHGWLIENCIWSQRPISLVIMLKMLQWALRTQVHKG